MSWPQAPNKILLPSWSQQQLLRRVGILWLLCCGLSVQLHTSSHCAFVKWLLPKLPNVAAAFCQGGAVQRWTGAPYVLWLLLDAIPSDSVVKVL
jgi:hypothetical protein